MANTMRSRSLLDRNIICFPWEKFRKSEFKVRKCFSCDRPMTFREFEIEFDVYMANNHLGGLEISAKEIWDNEIFVLQCCYCHKGTNRARVGWVDYPSDWYQEMRI